MIVRTQSIAIDCDCPSYAVVEGCRLIGLVRPEDVPWSRIPYTLTSSASWLTLWLKRTWAFLIHAGCPWEMTCSCGQPLVSLMKYLFTFDTGDQACYRIGQCDRCLKVYWREEKRPAGTI